MIKLNNKGLSLTEIIVSISLISIVLVFLLGALVTVKNNQSKNTNKIPELINQAVVIRDIERELRTLGLKELSHCSDIEIAQRGISAPFSYDPITTDGGSNYKSYCLKFKYKTDLADPSNTTNYLSEINSTAFLTYYTYKSGTNNVGVITYKRGNHQVSRVTTVDTKGKTANGIIKDTCDSNTASGKCILTITLPVRTVDETSYDIELSYYHAYSGISFANELTTAKNGFQKQ